MTVLVRRVGAPLLRLTVVVGLIAGGLLVFAAPSGAATGWSVTASPSPPGPPDGALSSVSCASASRCFAVGNSATGTFIESWNGTRWSVVSSPNPKGQGGAALSGVACVTVSMCFAVGGTNTRTLVERWNGARWSIVASPNPPSPLDGGLSGVSCASAKDCFAVGDSLQPNGFTGTTLVEHWNGSDWTIVTSPNPGESSEAALSAVSCPNAKSCFAVGASDAGLLAERWNGSRWSIVRIPNEGGFARPAVSVSFTPGLTGVSCPTATNCYAVGSTDSGVIVQHWNGSQWAIVAVPKPHGAFFPTLAGVSCLKGNRCTAVGNYSPTSTAGPTNELVERFNGKHWSLAASPDLPATSEFGEEGGGISCVSFANCEAVGGSAFVDHWNGTAWSIAPLLTHASQSGLAQVSCPAANNCYGVGSYTTASGATNTLVELWNGTSWSRVASPNPADSSADLVAVSCASTADCSAVGYAATVDGIATLVEHWDGTAWSIVPSPNPGTQHDARLDGVSCAAPGNCYAVGAYTTASGSNAVIEHWDGTQWTLVTAPSRNGLTDAELESVSCPTTAACTAVGLGSTNSNTGSLPKTLVEQWSGTSWAIVSSPNPTGKSFPFLQGVSCASPTDCSAVGYTIKNLTSFDNVTLVPLAEHWNGTRWTIVPIPNPSGAQQTVLFGVTCTSTANCYAVGATATPTNATTLIDHWNGARWTRVSSPNRAGAQSSSLHGVSCPTPTRCYAVGDSETNASIRTLTERTA